MSEPSQLPQAAQPIVAMVLAKLGRGWDGEGLSDVLLSAHSQLHVTEHVITDILYCKCTWLPGVCLYQLDY